jgi:phosphate-selective porin OprO/OprP
MALNVPVLNRKFGSPTLRRGMLAGAIGLLFTAHIPAHADAVDNLLDRLKAKGVISDEEYNEIKDERDGEKAVARKRRQEANEEMTKEEEVKKSGVQGWMRDGVVFESADKKNSIAINGRAQLDYRKFTGADVVGTDTFDIRRAYLGVAGKLWDYYTFDVTADFAGLAGNTTTNVCTAVGTNANGQPTCTSTTSVVNNTGSHLDVAWVNAAWWKAAQFRFGQFKMPFSLEELTSSRFIDFQERSFVNTFVPGKERGIMVHGQPTTGMFYGVALSAGQGKNTNEVNRLVDSNDLIARVGVNLAEVLKQPNNVYHVALDYSTGTVPSTSAPSLRTEGRGNTFFSTSSFGVKTDRERVGAEGSLAFGPVKLQGEYVKNNFSGNGFDRDIKVYYVGASWLLTGEKYADAYKGGAYSRIKPNNNFTPGGSGKGAWELGVRFSNFDGSDFSSAGPGQASSSLTDKAKAFTVGLKWIPAPSTRFLLNYVKTDFDNPITFSQSGNPSASKTTDSETAITLRAQIDF